MILVDALAGNYAGTKTKSVRLGRSKKSAVKNF